VQHLVPRKITAPKVYGAEGVASTRESGESEPRAAIDVAAKCLTDVWTFTGGHP